MEHKRKCVLVSLNDDISEIRELADSLELDVLTIFVQFRKNPNPKYYVGSGKVKEIKDYIDENKIDIAVFNASLKPSQQYNLENFLEITVFDRIRLILEIFADRAHSEEAKLQVELAKLQYEIPLLRDWIHKARYGERPGFMAGGEYEVAQYYEICKRRIKKNKQKLKKIEKEREIRRKQRREIGYYLVSIVGYTNAGKSTLFNLIAGESVAVEDKLFTTLSTTTRRISDLKKPIILTDTVGLIDNLPHWIIGAFHSTLEEIFLSDLILLIIDGSEPIDEINRKLKTSFDVLLPDLEPSKIVLLINKIDKVQLNNRDKEEILDKVTKNLLTAIVVDHKIKDIIPLSAIEEEYKENIINLIIDVFDYPARLSIVLPNQENTQSFVSWLHSHCEIQSIKYGRQIKIDLKCREKNVNHITKKSSELGGNATIS
ncbi:MAG: GTPase HflX [Methanomassiliicoccales archaeon]|nr:MAG: GTPase HflX [Methanomassiliicoccales archaeon]